MEITYLLHALFKRKWIILFCTLFTLFVTAFFLLSRKKTYESAAQYSTGFTIQQVSLINEEFNPYEADTKFNNVLETFKSPKVIGMLSYDLMLHDLQNPSRPFRELTSRKMNTESYSAVNPAQAKLVLRNKVDSLNLLSTVNPEEKKLLDYLTLYEYDFASIQKNLIIERIPRTDYLTIVYRSENNLLSAYVVNKIGEEFLRFYSSLSSTLTTESVEKISNIVDQKRRQVDSITENLRREKASQGALDPVELGKSAMQTVNNLNSKLADEKSAYNKTFFQLQSVNNQLEKLSSNPNAITTGNNQEIVRIRTKLRELATQKDDPKVADQIRKLQDDLRLQQSTLNSGTNPEGNRDGLLAQKSDLEEELKASDETINYLNKEIQKYSSLNTGAGSDVKLNSLKSEVDIATKEYSDIKSKFMQAEGYKESPGINFKQTLVGQPAVEPEPSHFLLIMSIAGLSMLAITSLVIILLELLDSSIKSPSRFNNVVGLPLLNPVIRVSQFKKKSLFDLFESINEGSKKVSREKLFIRFIRKIRYSIEASGKQVILFTSTKKGEGKTTIIEALATSLSMSNRKILIIDSNFSNNSLTQDFGVEGNLEDISIAGDHPDFSTIKKYIVSTPIKGVDIIGCKGGSYTPDEILSGNNLFRQLSLIKGQYDFILIEAACMNENSDTAELSKYAEGVVAVFGADSIINQQDMESVQFLFQSKVLFIGSVLNKVEKENIDI